MTVAIPPLPNPNPKLRKKALKVVRPVVVRPVESPAVLRTTTVFTSGNSQAVRLPKEFRIDSKHVFIERRGVEIVLRPKPRPQSMRDFLDQLVHIPDAPLQEPDGLEEPVEAW